MVMATSASDSRFFCPVKQGRGRRSKHLYRDPRILDCLHSFCKNCLEYLSTNYSTINCPTCSKVTSLDDKSVYQLPKDIRLAQETAGAEILSKVHKSPTCEKCNSKDLAALYCLDCGEFLCDDCETVHQKWKALMNHTRITLSDLPECDLSTLCPPVHILCPKHYDEVGSHFCSASASEGQLV